MNRREYMAQLSYLLQDMPESERQDVLNYYENYFDEGGSEQEELIIRTLGSPERLAAIIKEGMQEEEGSAYGEYTESGYRDDRFREDDKVPQEYYEDSQSYEEVTGKPETGERNRRNTVLWIAILVIFVITLGTRMPFLIIAVLCIWILKHQKDRNEKGSRQ